MNNRDDEKHYEYNSNNTSLRRNRSSRSSSESPSRLEKRLEKKARKEKRKSFFRGVMVFFIVAIIISIIVGTGIGIGMYTAVSTEISDMKISDLALNTTSTIVYIDESGNERELEEIKTTESRKWIPSEEISQNLKNAAVAIEDQRFYEHHGVDIKRTFGATVKYVFSKLGFGDASYGGSTITQQVIKNITTDNEKDYKRKIREMMRAVALEKQLTKDEILTMYLNVAFFANNCYGVEAASNLYFGKHASELNIEESATIVGITQMPGRYDPIKHPENNIEKRNTVLGKMLELNMITDSEYNRAVESSLKILGKKGKKESNISSYFVDQVFNDVISDLQSVKGYSMDYATQQLTNGGLKIYATIDPLVQEKIEKVYENKGNFPSASAQSAMVILDPYTGQIKGLVGGIGVKNEARGFNRATQAKRQPGSSIKPLSVYSPALDLEKIDESIIIKDEEITIGSDKWKPSNSYKGFKGNMILREAVGRSANIPAVKVLDMIGLNKSYSYLSNNFGLGNLKDEDKNYSSLALGGLTTGTTTREMAAAYATFVNGGKYYKPHTYTKVVDSSGNVVLDNTPTSNQAIKKSTAYIMADLLRAPINDGYGTARGAKLSGFETFGKTGTTNDNYDKWFVGFTTHYVGAVWYGFDSPKSVGGSNPSVAVWKNVMQLVHEGLDNRELEIPDDVVQVKLCRSTGKLAKGSCDSVTSYFTSGDQPKKSCTGHSSSSSSSKYSEESSEDEESDTPNKTSTKKTDTKTETETKSKKSSGSTETTKKTESTTNSVPIKESDDGE